MNTAGYIAIGLGALLWFAFIWFFASRVITAFIHHLLWLRWQRRHRHHEPLRRLGKTNL